VKPDRVAKATLRCFVHMRSAQFAIRSTAVKGFPRVISDDIVLVWAIYVSVLCNAVCGEGTTPQPLY
jgi:hypothetical protein